MQIFGVVAAVAFDEIEDQIHLASSEGEERGVAAVELDVGRLVVELGESGEDFFAIELRALALLPRRRIVEVLARILFGVFRRFVENPDLHARN